MRIRNRFLTFALAAGLFLAAPPAGAQSPQGALPAFTVTAPDGQAVASETLAPSSAWILVYLDPSPTPCAELVRLLQKWQTPQLLSRLVLVVRASPNDARTWLERTLGGDRVPFNWVADNRLEAWTALGLDGSPVLVGLKQGQVEWRLMGILSRVESLESIVRSWVEQLPGGGRP